MQPINWTLLADAVEFYERRGYRYVELPWAALESVCALTAPEGSIFPNVQGLGTLIGSAEQSFLQATMGGLPEGRYCALTPCFRVGEVEDNLHRKTFMKVELFSTLAPAEIVDIMRDDAESYFNRALAQEGYQDIAGRLNWMDTEDGHDLNLGDIEVGSYGVRTANDITWAYGTGLAEPRWSTACQIVANDARKDRMAAYELFRTAGQTVRREGHC